MRERIHIASLTCQPCEALIFFVGFVPFVVQNKPETGFYHEEHEGHEGKRPLFEMRVQSCWVDGAEVSGVRDGV